MKTALLSIVMISLMAACAATVGPDAVSFPSGYKSQVLVATVDRPDIKQVRQIYATQQAAQLARAGKPLADGAVFAMEIYPVKADAKGELAKDSSGRLVKGDLAAVFVMEKRAGFGANYPEDIRTGDWEYSRFSPDGQRLPDQDSTQCMKCHKPLTKQDFLFTLPRLAAAK